MDMSMPMGTATTGPIATKTPPGEVAPATSSPMSMGTIGAGGTKCKIAMLWNWNTVDTCFISSAWQVTSEGMFAGSCIGVILLVMTLEALRRAVKEYDRYLVRNHLSSTTAASAEAESATAEAQAKVESRALVPGSPCPALPTTFRPSVAQQAVRATLHMVQFAVAYFIMLLAMYYNGYFIICIFIGAYLGAFVFGWETLGSGRSATSATQEATVCCG